MSNPNWRPNSKKLRKGCACPHRPLSVRPAQRSGPGSETKGLKLRLRFSKFRLLKYGLLFKVNQFEGLFWRRSQILRHPQVKVDVGAFCFELTSASVLYKESQKYMDKNDKNTTLNLSTSSADYFVTTVLRMTCEEPEPQNISRSTKSRNSDRLKAARQHLGISTLPSSIIGEMRKHQRIQRKAPSTSLKGSFIGSIVTFTGLHCPPKQLKFSNHWSTSVAA